MPGGWQTSVYRSFKKYFEQLHMKLFNVPHERKCSRCSAQIQRLSMNVFVISGENLPNASTVNFLHKGYLENKARGSNTWRMWNTKWVPLLLVCFGKKISALLQRKHFKSKKNVQYQPLVVTCKPMRETNQCNLACRTWPLFREFCPHWLWLCIFQWSSSLERSF